jgi:hypothetical protein
VDSHLCQNSTNSVAELLTKYRVNVRLSKEALAAKLGMCIGTLKNWEFRRTRPNRKSWLAIRAFLTTYQDSRTFAQITACRKNNLFAFRNQRHL